MLTDAQILTKIAENEALIAEVTFRIYDNSGDITDKFSEDNLLFHELLEARALLRYLPELALELEGARQEQEAMIKAHKEKWDGDEKTMDDFIGG